MSFLFVPYAIHVIMVSIFVVYVFVDLPFVLNMTPELNLVQTDNYRRTWQSYQLDYPIYWAFERVGINYNNLKILNHRQF